MRLYWHPFSIFPRRVRIALREKSIACEEVQVDLPGGALRAPEFRRLNPFAQVPVLEDDGLVVFESLAILEYLEERHPTPALLPTERAGRARARALMQAAGDYFAPPFKRWLAQYFTPDTADPADIALAATQLREQVDILHGLLGGQDYLLGTFSLADIAYAPLACELSSCGLAELASRSPRLAGWIARMQARPAVRDTAPEPLG